VLTSKAIINGIEGIEGIEGLNKLKLSKKHKTDTPSPMTPIKTPTALRIKKLKNKTVRMLSSIRGTKLSSISRSRKNKEIDNLLFVEKDILPSMGSD
jgi:hypothetical protein